jgi:hypothetical protein
VFIDERAAQNFAAVDTTIFEIATPIVYVDAKP